MRSSWREAWVSTSRRSGACGQCLPGVRLACDRYVQFVRDSSLLEAVASSLTELFAPTLMSRRIEVWKRHYPWVSSDGLGYFQLRIARASLDSKQSVEFVVQHALSRMSCRNDVCGP